MTQRRSPASTWATSCAWTRRKAGPICFRTRATSPRHSSSVKSVFTTHKMRPSILVLTRYYLKGRNAAPTLISPRQSRTLMIRTMMSSHSMGPPRRSLWPLTTPWWSTISEKVWEMPPQTTKPILTISRVRAYTKECQLMAVSCQLQNCFKQKLWQIRKASKILALSTIRASFRVSIRAPKKR